MASGPVLQSRDIADLVLGACRRIDREQARLSELDAACGDGDHGVSMARGFRAVHEALRGADQATPTEVVRTVGRTLVSAMGGAMGPLMGTLFLEAAASLEATTGGIPHGSGVDTRGLAAAFRAGLEGVCRRGGAKPGEKTMVDALAPAVQALETAAEAGLEPAAALGAAARAARSGASATASLLARQGKSRYLGERARGHEDAGANSVALLFEGFADAAARGDAAGEKGGA